MAEFPEPNLQEDIVWLNSSPPQTLVYDDDEARNFRTHEKTVEIVGVAKDLESPVDFLFKFTLENLESRKIQVLAWKPQHEHLRTVVRHNHYSK